MKRSHKLMRLLGVLMIAGLIISACAPAATPTPAPTEAIQPTEAPTKAPTQAPEATEAPTEAAATEAPTEGAAGDLMKTEAPNCDYGGEFKSIEAVDPMTVKFTLCVPDPAFLSKVAFAAFAIQDSDYLDEMGGDSNKISENPNGTGPYILKEWVRGDHITFEPNPNYWGEASTLQTLIFRYSPEPAQRLLDLQAGTADGISLVASEDMPGIQSDSALKLYPFSSPNVFYIGMNNTIEPFDDVKVRQAVAMAIDKQRIVDDFYPPGSMPAEQFVPPDISPGFSTSGDGATWYEYDPEAAKQLLADAGYPDGFTVDLSFRPNARPYLPLPAQVAQDIQSQLADVGITANINQMESGAFLESVAAGQQGLFLLGWGMDYPDATNFYDFHFTGGNPRFGDQFDDLIKEIKAAAQLSDPSERQTRYDLVNALIKQYVPVVPVAHGTQAHAFQAAVGNVVIGPLNENFQQMTTDSGQLVWVQSGEPISLWCGDETDGETLRACLQLYDSLLAYEFGGTQPVPALAESWESSPDATEWTFTLRQGVKFSNGADLDANDVVASFSAQWDAANANHKGNTGAFEYFAGFFGDSLNAPPP